MFYSAFGVYGSLGVAQGTCGKWTYMAGEQRVWSLVSSRACSPSSQQGTWGSQVAFLSLLSIPGESYVPQRAAAGVKERR